ncbi:IS5 family transposase [Inquilinus sp. OTU3971]|uniref:IS5 family transposase n=1 Tax=Inquilinus sp. OTU3971 TaxID=3043855 RepID=UPI00313E4215
MTRHRSGTRRARYAVRNWPAYDRALIRRGELSIWISPSALDAWRGGGGRLYSDAAIEAALTVRAVFRLALRQTEGLVGSIFRMLGLSLPVPDHTTLSRRGRRLETDRRADAGDGVDLVIDSTGLRLWRRGSPPGRTGWRKLHVAIDPNTGTILAEALTDGDVHDTQAVPGLLSRIDGRIDRVYGDGAGDRRHQRCPGRPHQGGGGGGGPGRSGGYDPRRDTRNPGRAASPCSRERPRQRSQAPGRRAGHQTGL